MSWDELHFQRFVDATVGMARGELPGYGYPHVVFPYAPEDENTCISQIRSILPGRLGQAGLDHRLISVAQLVACVTGRYARRELLDSEDYRLLQGDLAADRSGLVAKTARLMAETIHGAPPETVVVLCRLGALYPFGHVSALLQAAYTAGIRDTIAVAYPGTADGIQLRFLGLNDPTGGYRGHVVT